MWLGTIATSWAVCCVDPLPVVTWPALPDLVSVWEGLQKWGCVSKGFVVASTSSRAHLIPPKVNCSSEVTSELWKNVRLSSTDGHAAKRERGFEYSTGSIRKVYNGSGPWALQCRTCPAQSCSLTFLPARSPSQEKNHHNIHQSTCSWQHLTQTPACQAQLGVYYYWSSVEQAVYWLFDQGGLGEGSIGEYFGAKLRSLDFPGCLHFPLPFKILLTF